MCRIKSVIWSFFRHLLIVGSRKFKNKAHFNCATFSMLHSYIITMVSIWYQMQISLCISLSFTIQCESWHWNVGIFMQWCQWWHIQGIRKGRERSFVGPSSQPTPPPQVIFWVCPWMYKKGEERINELNSASGSVIIYNNKNWKTESFQNMFIVKFFFTNIEFQGAICVSRLLMPHWNSHQY